MIDTLSDLGCEVLKCSQNQNSFSLVLLLESKEIRDTLREKLRLQNIFSNVLWNIRNEKASFLVKDFSNRMLSLPIDFRYSKVDMLWMGKVLISTLQNLR